MESSTDVHQSLMAVTECSTDVKEPSMAVKEPPMAVKKPPMNVILPSLTPILPKNTVFHPFPSPQSTKVKIQWVKQGLDALELWVDRGDGKGFGFLAIDTIVPYVDTAALPAAGQSALWKYKGIYLQADERVGQWSDIVSLAVNG